VTGLEAERQGQPIHITARLVVGADGALSNVRQSLGIAAEMYLYPEAYLIAILDSGSEITDAKYFVGNRSILGMFPAAGRKVYLFYMIPAGSFERVKADGFEPLRAAWTRIDPSGESLFRNLTDWTQTAYMPTGRVKAATWVADGAALLGDAADHGAGDVDDVALHHAAPAVEESDELVAVDGNALQYGAADDRVQSGAVATAGEDSDPLGHRG
jgi:2-polyprenyl-6-methoxyphenol hydroxylase-like FAD-dependent oxidoreductase